MKDYFCASPFGETPVFPCMLWTESLHLYRFRGSCHIMFKFFPCTYSIHVDHWCFPFFPPTLIMQNLLAQCVKWRIMYNSNVSGDVTTSGSQLEHWTRNRFLVLIPRGHILHWGFVGWLFCWVVLLQGQRRPQVHTIWTARDLNHCLTSTRSGLSVATKIKKKCRLVL